jgi:hypothetical protein
MRCAIAVLHSSFNHDGWGARRRSQPDGTNIFFFQHLLPACIKLSIFILFIQAAVLRTSWLPRLDGSWPGVRIEIDRDLLTCLRATCENVEVDCGESVGECFLIVAPSVAHFDQLHPLPYSTHSPTAFAACFQPPVFLGEFSRSSLRAEHRHI